MKRQMLGQKFIFFLRNQEMMIDQVRIINVNDSSSIMLSQHYQRMQSQLLSQVKVNLVKVHWFKIPKRQN